MILTEGRTIVVFGTTSTREGEKPKVKGENLTLLSAAPMEFPTALNITVDDDIDENLPERIMEQLARKAGDSEVRINLTGNGRRTVFRSAKFKVEADRDLVLKLEKMVGPDKVKLVRLNEKR
jgi:hypothetical protein